MAPSPIRGWLLRGVFYCQLAFCLGHPEGCQPVPHPDHENPRFLIWGVLGRRFQLIEGPPGVRPELAIGGWGSEILYGPPRNREIVIRVRVVRACEALREVSWGT